MRADRGAPDEGIHVANRPERGRVVLGIAVTPQTLVFVLAALALTAAVGMAVLSWLQRSA